MRNLHKYTKRDKNFLINDQGKLIQIKQPNIIELQTLYWSILYNIKKNRTKFVH